MDLSIAPLVTPDVYEPSMDDNGNFVDKMPSWSCLKGRGIMCGCGSRKDKVYETVGGFTSHIKTKAHIKWIDGLNANKVNLYMENVQLKRIVIELRHILSRYEIDCSKMKRNYEIELLNKQQTIDSLTKLLQELNETSTTEPNIMDY